MTPRAQKRIPHAKVAVLGLITISVYGSWSYGFGVYLDPLVADTGWSEAGVVAVFGASAAIAGFGAAIGGWVLDSWGSRVVFGVGAVVGTTAFLGASAASSFSSFAALAAVGGGVFGALGFYHVTQTVAARLGGESSDRAITALTVWGAFAGVIYLPLAAWLIEYSGWRMALALLTGSAGACLTVGSVFVESGRSQRKRPSLWAGVRDAVRSRDSRRFIISVSLAGIAVSVLVVYQVPLMVGAGLSLGVASGIAGARSLAQLLGRLPLRMVLDRMGKLTAIRLSFLAIGLGSLLAVVAGNLLLGVVFAVVAGFGVGSMSPLVGIFSVEIFPSGQLGVGRGTVAAAGSATSAMGPLLGSLAVALTDSRSAAAILGAAAAVAAVVFITPIGFRDPDH